MQTRNGKLRNSIKNRIDRLLCGVSLEWLTQIICNGDSLPQATAPKFPVITGRTAKVPQHTRDSKQIYLFSGSNGRSSILVKFLPSSPKGDAESRRRSAAGCARCGRWNKRPP